MKYQKQSIHSPRRFNNNSAFDAFMHVDLFIEAYLVKLW